MSGCEKFRGLNLMRNAESRKATNRERDKELAGEEVKEGGQKKKSKLEVVRF